MYSETAWHLTATYALLGEEAAARRLAQIGARAFAGDATHMPPEIASAYAQLSWNKHLAAYLEKQPVALHVDEG
jgi:hypothetical protein